MTGLMRYAKTRSVALGANAPHVFAASHALVHYPSGAIYSFIPKNGCTSLRVSLAIAHGCIAGPEAWDWVHQNNGTFAADLSDLVRAPFSFVVLRCPHARLVSAFLDKIVEREPDMWAHHRAIRGAEHPDDYSFRGFVASLARPEILGLNIHWRAQADFLVYDDYSRWFAFERFDEIAPVLQDHLGLRVVDARPFSHGRSAALTRRAGIATPDTRALDLLALRADGIRPDVRDFYDDELAELVAALYPRDLAVYARRCGAGGALYPKLAERAAAGL